MDNEIVVMSVSRVPPLGKLVVSAVGGKYESMDEVDDEAIRRMISAAIAELVVFAGGYEQLVQSGLAPPVAAGNGPTASAIPATQEERQAAFEEALELQKDELLIATTAPVVAEKEEPMSIPDQINPLIQKHLAADPQLAGHVVKLEQDLKGNLTVIADGKAYERPDMIEDLAVRKAIRAALSEWDRT
jgi:hypothetical protein